MQRSSRFHALTVFSRAAICGLTGLSKRNGHSVTIPDTKRSICLPSQTPENKLQQDCTRTCRPPPPAARWTRASGRPRACSAAGRRCRERSRRWSCRRWCWHRRPGARSALARAARRREPCLLVNLRSSTARRAKQQVPLSASGVQRGPGTAAAGSSERPGDDGCSPILASGPGANFRPVSSAPPPPTTSLSAVVPTRFVARSFFVPAAVDTRAGPAGLVPGCSPQIARHARPILGSAVRQTAAPSVLAICDASSWLVAPPVHRGDKVMIRSDGPAAVADMV